MIDCSKEAKERGINTSIRVTSMVLRTMEVARGPLGSD
jgi:hypothetical protein